MKVPSDTPETDQATTAQAADRIRCAVTKAADMVRVETTIDQLPIWAPSSYADERKRVYPLDWRAENASVTVQASGEYGMLRSFDKLVLTALVHLWNEQGRDEKGRVYFQVIDVIHALDKSDDGRTYQRVKNSLQRLFGCVIQYHQSFFDSASQEWLTLRNKTVLTDLLIVEPRREAEDGVQMAMEGLTYATLDFQVVANLIGNFTRPVSLKLLNTLSERGILFESYVNSVLYTEPFVRKDVFSLWIDLGLSVTGVDYASRLAAKMRNDLDKMVTDDTCPLGRYDFEKSKTRARSQNLLLYRAKDAVITKPAVTYQTPDDARERYEVAQSADLDRLVDELRMILHDESSNDTNVRLIAARLDTKLVRQLAYDAWAYYRDGHAKNATAYFVGMARKRAKDQGVDLGFKSSGGSDKGGATSARTGGSGDELRGLTSDLASRFQTGKG